MVETNRDIIILCDAVNADDEGALEALADALEEDGRYAPYHEGWGCYGWWCGGGEVGDIPEDVFYKMPGAGASRNRLYFSLRSAYLDLARGVARSREG